MNNIVILNFSKSNILTAITLHSYHRLEQPAFPYLIVAHHKSPYVPISNSPFYLHDLTLIPVWISNYIRHKAWDEIT